MRTKIAALLLLASIACSKSDPAPSYSSISGDWNISSNSLTGKINFYLNSPDLNYTSYSGSNQKKYFNIGSEQFLVQGTTFVLKSKNDATGISFNGTSSNRTVLVTLKDGSINTTFDKISSSKYTVTQDSFCGTNCVTTYNESIVLTRY